MEHEQASNTPAQLRARREAELTSVRERWTARAAEQVGIDVPVVERVVEVLVDHSDDRGHACACSCHPRFSTEHDGGFGCHCTRTTQQRKSDEQAAMAQLAELGDLQDQAEERERQELERWLAAEPGVVAERTCPAAPEVWEGRVDERSFYFRERGGEWRIELDLRPDGRFARRIVRWSADGEWETEQTELTSGDVIARGVLEDLGDDAVERLSFIVRTVRDRLRREACDHADARAWCPDCGERAGPTWG